MSRFAIMPSNACKPGQTPSTRPGHGAKYGTILTNRYIFTNSAYDKDGVRISTYVGKLYKACPAKPVPPERWIEVNLSAQYLTAWVGNTVVNGTLVSTGKPASRRRPAPTTSSTATGTTRWPAASRVSATTCRMCRGRNTSRTTAMRCTEPYWHNDFGTHEESRLRQPAALVRGMALELGHIRHQNLDPLLAGDESGRGAVPGPFVLSTSRIALDPRWME